ncbi:efflux RND transporter periplasmic adaptor subunit [Roseovarius sp. LXJ103]|uniref:efflux RND transporter periplasmic adaptor subunit n=1 Tax=Roseovarius carneus TaxID=2853164 RepID=UPI000D60E0FA|nr:efflux RND transporter periplasmic adaptor subunit [Roseovarius carneus]MBZ8119791.1 efflux RND transporter periplasmic adaptor subunit [Roseovarius carneus]PWE34610.1 efflux RND transporter periplasmic adaptor subunit [Pelagicola sp. LXJ1103]
MRILPIVTAVIVSVAIYAFVFERDSAATLLGGPDEPPEAAQQTNEAGPDIAAQAPIGVVAMHSVAQTIDSAVIVRGQTEALRQVDVRAETSGKIVSDPLRKGAFVDEGALLCRLNPATRLTSLAEAKARRDEAEARVPEAAARLAEARSRLEEAQINDNAAQQLSEGGFASAVRVAGTKASVSAAEAAVQGAKSGLDAARTGISSADASIAVWEEEIDRLEIRAPFAGMLETDTAELGSLLQDGALCGTVIQLDPIKLVGFVPETEVDRIAPGARAGATTVSGRQVEGRVTFLSRSADPETRTFRVEIEVSNADLSLRDGQTAEILISSDGTPAHLLPQSALTLNDEGTLGLRVLAEGARAEFMPVRLLRDTVDGVWLADLPDTLDVIIIGQEYVTDGVAIAPSFEGIAQ